MRNDGGFDRYHGHYCGGAPPCLGHSVRLLAGRSARDRSRAPDCSRLPPIPLAEDSTTCRRIAFDTDGTLYAFHHLPQTEDRLFRSMRHRCLHPGCVRAGRRFRRTELVVAGQNSVVGIDIKMVVRCTESPEISPTTRSSGSTRRAALPLSCGPIGDRRYQHRRYPTWLGMLSPGGVLDERFGSGLYPLTQTVRIPGGRVTEAVPNQSPSA